MVAVLGLDGGAPQGLAVTQQLVQILCPTWDLADHPGLHHLAEVQQVGLIEEVEERGIGRPALEIEAQGLVQRFSVPFGECLQIAGAPAAAEDPEHRHQQQESLAVAHPSAVPAIRNGLEEADQINRCLLIGCSGMDGGHRQR